MPLEWRVRVSSPARAITLSATAIMPPLEVSNKRIGRFDIGWHAYYHAHAHIISWAVMKTERVTLLTSPDFKAFLGAEARREGVSVAELVRTRCERRPTEEEAVLAALTGELHKAVSEAKKSLKSGLDEAQAVLRELRAKRVDASAVAEKAATLAARRRRKPVRARA